MTEMEISDLKVKLAKQCLDSGKAPIFMINFDPEKAPMNYNGHVNPEDVKPGMSIYVNSSMRHYDSTEIKEDGLLVPSVQAASYENGVFIVESRSTFVCSVDFEKEYKELMREKELATRKPGSLKQTIGGKDGQDVVEALRQRCQDAGMRPILMTGIRWTSLSGNHNSSNELPHYLNPGAIEPGMRVYLSCKMIDMETGEVLNKSSGEMCIPNVADACVHDGHLFIESANGNFVTTLDMRERVLEQTQEQDGANTQTGFDVPEIGE